jgi:putative transcriptional regulator
VSSGEIDWEHGASLRGRLLVATPPLVDPNFARTVVLMLEHGAEGSLGLVLNRPSTTELADALPAWYDIVSRPALVFIGGPVSADAVIALGRRPHAPPAAPDSRPAADDDGWIPLIGDLGTIDVGRDPSDVAPGVEELRVFLGYAGWAPHQLEEELRQGSWFVVEADATDAFATDPSSLWTDVLRRQPSRIAIFATCPPDPSVN